MRAGTQNLTPLRLLDSEERACNFYINIFLRELMEILLKTTEKQRKYPQNDEKLGPQVIRR